MRYLERDQSLRARIVCQVDCGESTTTELSPYDKPADSSGRLVLARFNGRLTRPVSFEKCNKGAVVANQAAPRRRRWAAREHLAAGNPRKMALPVNQTVWWCWSPLAVY